MCTFEPLTAERSVRDARVQGQVPPLPAMRFVGKGV